jgi:hypothetical protein
MSDVAKILRASAARVRQGWCQGVIARGPNVCAFGAIEEVMGDWWGASLIADVAEKCLHLKSANNTVLRALAEWNDAPGQTAESVALGLEYAALLLEQEHAQSALAPSQLQETT